MLDFVKAALPWVVIGIAIIIVCVNAKSNKAKTSSETTDAAKKDEGNYMSIGMCVGMGIGMLVGQLLYNNLSLGLCIGMSIGIAVGNTIKKTKDTPTD